MKEMQFDTSNKALYGDEKNIVNCFLNYKNYRTNESIEKLLESMHFTFKIWADSIKEENFYNDFTIYSICRFLDTDNKPIGPVEIKIKTYKKFLKRNDIKIYEDIVFLFLEFLSKDTIDINYFKPKYFKRFLYHVAMEMKYLIFKRIRTVNQLCRRDALFHSLVGIKQIPIALIDTNDYSVYIDTNMLTLYENYFITLISYGFTFTQRMLLMHNNKKQQLQEEKETWQLLKKKLLDN